MASKLEAMLEAERRGILPADMQAALSEARQRGLIPALETAQQPVQTPERAALQAELNRNLAAADEAGKTLERREAVAENFVRPLASTLTNLADGSPLVSLPRFALNAG